VYVCNCVVCIIAKSKKQSYHTSVKNNSYKTGECIHADLVHAATESRRENKYFLILKDEASSFRQVYLQKKKDNTAENIIDALNFISNQTGNSVKVFRSDNGTEFVNEKLKQFFSEKGIQHGLNAPYTSASNGMIERDVRTVQDMARSMLIQSQLDEKHWDDAVTTACYILNRTLSSKNTEKTPFEWIFNRKPSVHHLKIFGCKAYAHIMEESRGGKKWTSRTRECLFVGYNSLNKNYRLYVPSERRYIEQVKHVVFSEESIRKIKNDTESDLIISTQHLKIQNDEENNQSEERSETSEDEEEEEINKKVRTQNESTDTDILELHPTENDNLEPPPNNDDLNLSWSDQMEEDDNEETFYNAEETPRIETPQPSTSRPKREKKPIDRYQAGFLTIPTIDNIIEPTSYKEAVTSKQKEDWIEAMESEMQSQASNGTWELVKRPPLARVLKNRWVYKIKPSPDGEQYKYKARLVVKGYNQIEGLDYEETFAPVCRYESVRILLSLAAALNLEMIQFDVETAFLNSDMDMDEPVYMEQPEGFVVGHNDKGKSFAG